MYIVVRLLGYGSLEDIQLVACCAASPIESVTLSVLLIVLRPSLTSYFEASYFNSEVESSSAMLLQTWDFNSILMFIIHLLRVLWVF